MLKTIQWTMLFDYERSPITGLVRKHWEEAFFTLLKGVIAYASEGKARVPLPGPQTRDKFADELEGFSRSFIMVGPWLRTSQTDTMTFAGETINVAGFYREGILAGTDPKHPEYWGNIVDRSQHLVECASLAWSLYLSQKHIWNKCSPAEKKQVANYLFQCTQAEYHPNNWLLFNVITNTVLKKLGMPYSQEQIDRNLRAVNEMYIGDGWYQDGLVNRIDYYNLWGFHYYHLMWVILDGESKPRIAKLHLNRMRILMKNFRYFFAGDGSTPCYGRSMIYRFAYLGPIALGLYLKCLTLDLGEVKTICNATLKFFFDNEILTNVNHLSMGYLRPCPAILEHYSCGGSPYWAAKAFNLFLLPESDPFWQTIEKPLAIHNENFSIPIKSAGFLIVGDQKTGHVQLINQKSYHDKPGYRKKYTNFVYSSVFAYEASSKYNCDNALTCSFDGGGKFRQRWQIENLYCQQDFAASRYKIYNIDDEVDRYKLYEADDMGWGYTYILVKDDFMVNVHRIETDKSLMFREGGYPLGFDEGEAEIISTEGAEAAYKDGKISFLRNLYGYTVHPASPLYQGSQGSNIRYKHSIVPTLGFENKDQKVFYLASMIYGKIGHASIEELMGLVTDFHIEDGLVMVTFYDSEKVVMQLGDIRNLALKLNGKRISGKVIMARVSADGEKSFILQETPKVPAFLSQSFRRLLQRC